MMASAFVGSEFVAKARLASMTQGKGVRDNPQSKTKKARMPEECNKFVAQYSAW